MWQTGHGAPKWRHEQMLIAVLALRPWPAPASQPAPGQLSVGLGLHLMRFALMEEQPGHAAVRTFLKDPADPLDSFVSGMEQYLASGAQSSQWHAEPALEHGIAVHRASLEWIRSVVAALAEPASGK
jgi:hypothetical protein